MLDKNKQFINPINFTAFEKPSFRTNALFVAILVFLALMIIWISLSPIDEIVKGQGKVIPSSRIQSIQTMDGGTIEKILVKEGSIVKAGQELMVIDDLRFNATVDELKNDLYSLKVKQIRLNTQNLIEDIKNIPELNYPQELKIQALSFVQSEKNHYKNKIDELKSLIDVETSKYEQKVQEDKEIGRKIKKLQQSKNNLKKQLKIMNKGVKDGIMSKIDQLKLQQEYNNTTGELDIARLALKRSKTAIKESYENIHQQITIFKVEASKELNKVEAEIKKIEAKLTYSNDKVSKSIIHSPVDGIVNHLYFTTIGGVVKTADVLIDIVPTDDSLLVEAKIDPRDIGFIGPNNEVTIKITAYDFSIYGGLKGSIEQIGADSIFDKETKKYYYQILVRTEKNFIGEKDKSLIIIPGMVCEVDIKTGKKTILEYLLKPITKTVNNAMRER